MKITDSNKTIVKAFIRMLLSVGLEKKTVEMIVSALSDVSQMRQLAFFLQENPKATESEILEKVLEISNI